MYTALDEIDNLSIRPRYKFDDVKNFYKKYCSRGLKPTVDLKYSNLCKVIKVYLAEAVDWMKEHDPEMFKNMTHNISSLPHLTLLSVLTTAESKMAKLAPPLSLCRNITL